MKIAAMNPEQRTEYQKLAKRRSREKAKQNRLAAQIPAARDYELPKAQQDQLTENARQITATIAAELPQLMLEDQRIVEMMSDVILSHERKITKEVHSPHGLLFGRYFPDAAASDCIEHFHRNPSLLESSSLADLYQRFLKLVWKLSKNESFDQDFAKEIEAETNGTYSLRPKPEIPQPAPAPPVPQPPDWTQIMEEGGNRLRDDLAGLPPDAHRYLYGGNR